MFRLLGKYIFLPLLKAPPRSKPAPRVRAGARRHPRLCSPVSSVYPKRPRGGGDSHGHHVLHQWAVAVSMRGVCFPPPSFTSAHSVGTHDCGRAAGTHAGSDQALTWSAPVIPPRTRAPCVSQPPFTMRAHALSPRTLIQAQGAQRPPAPLPAQGATLSPGSGVLAAAAAPAGSAPRVCVCVCVYTRVHVRSSLPAAQWESKV